MWLLLGITSAATGAVALIVANAESDRAKAIIDRELKRTEVALDAHVRAELERESLAARGCPRASVFASHDRAEQRLSALFADARRRVHNMED